MPTFGSHSGTCWHAGVCGSHIAEVGGRESWQFGGATKSKLKLLAAAPRAFASENFLLS
jgi:hypothetical protein